MYLIQILLVIILHLFKVINIESRDATMWTMKPSVDRNVIHKAAIFTNQVLDLPSHLWWEYTNRTDS